MDPSDRTTRRTVLAASGTALATLAGCFGSQESDGEPNQENDDGGISPAGTASSDSTPQSDGGTATVIASEQPLAAPVAGDPEADVTVAVYKDFACPHCKTFNQDVYPKLKREYIDAGEIRYEHHDFPLPVDESVSWEAPSAARAVQASVGDDAFFEYAKLLFGEQSQLRPNVYAGLADGVGADPGQIKTAAVERSFDETVEADRKRGIDAGVQGTPTVFVDGEPAPSSYDGISSAIDEA